MSFDTSLSWQLVSLSTCDCWQLGAWEMKHGTLICQISGWCQVKPVESEPALLLKWVSPRSQRRPRWSKRISEQRSTSQWSKIWGEEERLVRRGAKIKLPGGQHYRWEASERAEGELVQTKWPSQQQEPEGRRWWQGLQICLEGACSQVMCWVSESSWLDCIRCWWVVQMADKAGWWCLSCRSIPVQLWLPFLP